ncbi:MAG: hypothetical protein HY919_08530 [Elusimicrobia bacterium]|nr:hypothetical protein [Elusimicrobiota bacterium]
MEYLIKTIKQLNGHKVKRLNLLLLFTIHYLLFTASTGVVCPATPQEINYQGLLKKSNISFTGTSTMVFKIYDALTGGNQLWTSSSQSISVTKGNFSYILSGLDSIDWENKTCYLEITVDGTTMMPREKFTASAYALNASKVGGKSLTDLDSTYLKLTGGTLTGDLNSAYKIIGSTVGDTNTKLYGDGSSLSGLPGGGDMTKGVYDFSPANNIVDNSEKLNGQTASYYATASDLSAVKLDTGTLDTNKLNLSGGNLTGNVTANAGILIDGRDVGVDGTDLDNVKVDTGTLRTDLNAVKVDTGTLRTDLNAVKVDTGTLRTDLNADISNLAAVKVDTGTLRTDVDAKAGISDLNAVKVDTGTLRTDLTAETNSRTSGDNEIKISTGILRNEVITSTASLVLVDRDLATSTGTLDTNKLDKSSATATYVFKSGDTMTGDLNSAYKIIGSTVGDTNTKLYGDGSSLSGLPGGGDMTKGVYDFSPANNIVDNSEKLNGQTASYYATASDMNAVKVDTGTLRTDLNALDTQVSADTNTLRTDLYQTQLATGTNRTSITELEISTGTLLSKTSAEANYLKLSSATVTYLFKSGDTLTGDLKLNTAGNGLYIKEGTNATMGVTTLASGVATVSTTKVTANSRIFLTVQGGAVTNVGSTYISARTAGTSFTISSTNVLDASNIAWIIIEPTP